MGQNRTLGWEYQNVVAQSLPASFDANFTMDELDIPTPIAGGYDVLLDNAAVDGDRLKIKDVSGNAGADPNAIRVQTVLPLPPQVQAGILSPTFPGPPGTVFAIKLTGAFQEVQLTFSGALNAWLSSV